MGADAKTGLGALKMAEVLGLVHATRGAKKALVWHKGPGEPGRPEVWKRLPFRRLRDLLQHYRDSLVGTPDLMRDTGLAQREALGALKALVVLGYVEIGHLDRQTVAWKWVAGSGQRRVYQRGYYERQDAPVELDRTMTLEDGDVSWPWTDELLHREWLLHEEHDGFLSIAESDGLPRFRPPTLDSVRVTDLVTEGLRGMDALQRAATTLILLRGASEDDAAEKLGVSVSTVRRHARRGQRALQAVLTEAGYAPSVPHFERVAIAREELARAA
jgi:hypothetical protein